MVTKELDLLARNSIKEELKLIDPHSQFTLKSPIEFDSADV